MYQNQLFDHHQVCILSYADSHHYLVAVLHGDEKELIHDNHQRPISFDSQFQAQEWLKHHGIHQATLVLVSAYDEMIGHQDPVSESQLHCRF